MPWKTQMGPMGDAGRSALIPFSCQAISWPNREPSLTVQEGWPSWMLLKHPAPPFLTYVNHYRICYLLLFTFLKAGKGL